jgi:hypothetical protein
MLDEITRAISEEKAYKSIKSIIINLFFFIQPKRERRPIRFCRLLPGC